MCLGVPGKIVSITCEEPDQRAGRVSFGGVVREVNLAFVPEAIVGQYVIVHVGFAISVVDEEEAGKIFKHLAEMNSLSDLEAESA